MRIVVLDGYTLNPGDLSWDEIKLLGEGIIHDRTPAGLILQRAANAEIVLTNKTPLDAATIAALPALKYIGVMATGFNIVDIQAARARGIVVTNVPAYGTPSVVQTTFALLLELTHHIGDHNAAVHQGLWTRGKDFSFWVSPLVELDGLTMGIVGYGAIGRAVGDVARAFNMRVLAHNRTAQSATGVTFVDSETLFRAADIVTLHVPLTHATQNLINAQHLAMMKRTAFLINTARGALIDEAALAAALNEDRIAGAGLDVLSSEPPAADNPLLTAKNCIITPHIGWATKASRSRLMHVATENVRAFIAGETLNRVS